MKARGAFITMVLTLSSSAGWSATWPVDSTVLHGRQADRLLEQCSRDTPKVDGERWRPSAEDILALEAALPGALKAQAPHGTKIDWSRAPTGWRRQYAGFVFHGRRVIYGNFLPIGTVGSGAWRSVAQLVCDGGPSFFGVLYNPANHRFMSVAFNGSL